MRVVKWFLICFSISILFSQVSGVTINETLDTTAPASNPAYRAETGLMTGRLTRSGTVSACGSLKPNPGIFNPTGERQFDNYRFIALTSGCVTVTLSNAGNDVLFSAAYNQYGLSISDPSANYLGDPGVSPTDSNPSRSFSFDVVAGQKFHVVVHEVNAAGGIGQSYTLDLNGVKLAPDFTVNGVLDTTVPPSHPAYYAGTGIQTGRLSRLGGASTCDTEKTNPGLFTPTGDRRADLYRFVPASSGCAFVTLHHTGSDQAQIVVYDQYGWVNSDPSLNYLADPGQSASNSSVVFSFKVQRGVPFFVMVHEVTPAAGIGDNYTLNISNVNLIPTIEINSRLDLAAPPPNPDYVPATGQQVGRLNRNSPASTCDSPKPNPGLFSTFGLRQYDLYTVTPAASGCVQVTLSTTGTGYDFYSAAYNSSGFNPSNPSSNFLADNGVSPNLGNPRTYSFWVTVGQPFSVVVHEVNPDIGIGKDYKLEIGGIALNVTPRAAQYDFDGDSKTDLSIFRPSVGEWWYFRSSDQGVGAFTFGSVTDIPTPFDFTGDGKSDVAFFRPSSGTWYVLRSEDTTFYAFPFGANGDKPAPGDFDGDGTDDAAVFRPSTGLWFILRSSDSGISSLPFGASGDLPVVADYDGDGMDDVAIFRPSVREWWHLKSAGGVGAYQFGSPGDKTVQGDYTGDGKADVAFWRPSTGEWYVVRSEDSSFYAFPWGATGDIPTPGDYDGDGVYDAAVWRQSQNCTWFILGSTSGFQSAPFGAAGDKPLPSLYSVP